MKLYSYVVARDFGFAPNPFFGFCSLAACKPIIRRTAQVGDWVVGIGSTARGLEEQVVFALRVSETLTFDEYWDDPRFEMKRPNLYGSRMQAYGDNIYHHDPRGGWIQEDSHHSLNDGGSNADNIAHDTKTDRVLVSNEYTYWGGIGPQIPGQFRNWEGHDVRAHRGHKNSFPEDFVDAFLGWLRSVWGPGVVGRPSDW